MLRHEFTPLEIDEACLAFDAHLEVGSGGHFLGAAHTLERFRKCSYRPLLSSTENLDRTRNGGIDAAARAEKIWRETLDAMRRRRSTTPCGRSSGIRHSAARGAGRLSPWRAATA